MEDYSTRCKLSRLSQVGSVLDYQIEFEKLSSGVTETHEQILVSIFIFGLQPDIRWDLERNRPTALKEAFASARLQESRLEVLRLARNKIIEELADSDETGEIEAGTDMKMEEESLAPIFMPASSVESSQPNALPGFQLHFDGNGPKLSPLPSSSAKFRKGGVVDFAYGKRARSNRHEAGGNTSRVPFTQSRRSWHNEDQRIVGFAENGNESSCRKLSFGSRCLVIFGIYALEEVYKDLLYLHLEDKVILKGGGVDTLFYLF